MHVRSPPATNGRPDRTGVATGTLDGVRVPSPSCPRLLSPQHTVNAQAWRPPALTVAEKVALNPGIGCGRPTTLTGVRDESDAPLPNCPEVPRPQHRTERSRVVTHAKRLPTLMPVASSTWTRAGMRGSLTTSASPLPNDPGKSWSPQQNTWPSATSAQAFVPPAEMATTDVSHDEVNTTGTGLLARVPLPSWPSSPRPQHATVPFIFRTQVNRSPAATDRTSRRPATVVGRVAGADPAVPIPIWPSLLAPQQATVASARIAHV